MACLGAAARALNIFKGLLLIGRVAKVTGVLPKGTPIGSEIVTLSRAMVAIDIQVVILDDGTHFCCLPCATKVGAGTMLDFTFYRQEYNGDCRRGNTYARIDTEALVKDVGVVEAVKVVL